MIFQLIFLFTFFGQSKTNFEPKSSLLWNKVNIPVISSISTNTYKIKITSFCDILKDRLLDEKLVDKFVKDCELEFKEKFEKILIESCPIEQKIKRTKRGFILIATTVIGLSSLTTSIVSLIYSFYNELKTNELKQVVLDDIELKKKQLTEALHAVKLDNQIIVYINEMQKIANNFNKDVKKPFIRKSVLEDLKLTIRNKTSLYKPLNCNYDSLARTLTFTAREYIESPNHVILYGDHFNLYFSDCFGEHEVENLIIYDKLNHLYYPLNETLSSLNFFKYKLLTFNQFKDLKKIEKLKFSCGQKQNNTIQFKIVDEEYLIFCYPYSIKLNNQTFECPKYVFSFKVGTLFEINNRTFYHHYNDYDSHMIPENKISHQTLIDDLINKFDTVTHGSRIVSLITEFENSKNLSFFDKIIFSFDILSFFLNSSFSLISIIIIILVFKYLKNKFRHNKTVNYINRSSHEHCGEECSRLNN